MAEYGGSEEEPTSPPPTSTKTTWNTSTERSSRFVTTTTPSTTPSSRNGPIVISSSNTATRPEDSAAFSSMTSTTVNRTKSLPSARRRSTLSSRPTVPSWRSTRTTNSPRSRRNGSSCEEVGTLSSTSSTTAEPSLDSRLEDESRASSCPSQRQHDGNTIIKLRKAAQRLNSSRSANTQGIGSRLLRAPLGYLNTTNKLTQTKWMLDLTCLRENYLHEKIVHRGVRLDFFIGVMIPVSSC
mmetsp:Transcript_411/g.734  ORF Transcript_411/g.734 Transcript_411/m.734 type:complete len:240 (-) Transcript_411:614-1333(-)